MYAYAEIKGYQYRIAPGEEIQVPLFDISPGEKLEIAPLIAYYDGEKAIFGEACQGLSAKATVVSHGKSLRILVFRKKRRKDFRKRIGHRQGFTTIKIDEIVKAQEA